MREPRHTPIDPSSDHSERAQGPARSDSASGAPVSGTRLEPHQRADTAAKQILLTQLAALRLNEAGTLAETDIECLHDYRVAVRRTRAALSQIKAVFPAFTATRYAAGFAELGRITSEPRDLDVYLLDFERHLEELPEALRAELEPLRALLLERARKAHARLNAFLASDEYQRLLQSWERFLRRPPPVRSRARNASAPIQALAGHRVWKLYRRVVAEGRAITPACPAEQVHALRKTAKKLRYLMEFFRSLYPPGRIGALIKALKGFQDHLGAYQDAHTQIVQLRQFAEELRESGAPTASLLAIGALLDRRHGMELSLRAEFPEHFAVFAEAGHRRKFRQLFKLEKIG